VPNTGHPAVAPLLAHHSFGVAFDVTKPVTVTGVITAIEWMNPHSHVYMDVKEKSGKIVKWKFEGYPPNVLSRTGWKKDVTRHDHDLRVARARRHAVRPSA
jgi:hypothetical protein